MEEETWAIRVISRGLSSITYDRTTGNVIAAMGLQGVVVGSPDGRWTSIRMDIYGPTDFSSEAKLRLISTDTHAWLIVIATTLTFATAGLIASFTFTRYNTDTLLLGIGSGVLVAIPLILTARSDEWTILTLPLLVVLFIPLPVAVVDSSLGRGLRVYLATCSFFLLAAVWYTYFLITHIGDRPRAARRGHGPGESGQRSSRGFWLGSCGVGVFLVSGLTSWRRTGERRGWRAGRGRAPPCRSPCARRREAGAAGNHKGCPYRSHSGPCSAGRRWVGAPA